MRGCQKYKILEIKKEEEGEGEEDHCKAVVSRAVNGVKMWQRLVEGEMGQM